MRFRILLSLTVAGLLAGGTVSAAEREFAFFNILKDGKADKDALGQHCGEQHGLVRALSSASINLTQKEQGRRVTYKDKQYTNANANPGEWTTEVYKALCPGLYTFTVDYTAAPKDGATSGDIAVQIYVWHKTGKLPRPGELVAVADKTGKGRGTGHANTNLLLNTGDEVSTYSTSADGKPRFFERITLNAYRAVHMPQLAADFDNVWWEEDRVAADKTRIYIEPAQQAPAK